MAKKKTPKTRVVLYDDEAAVANVGWMMLMVRDGHEAPRTFGNNVKALIKKGAEAVAKKAV